MKNITALIDTNIILDSFFDREPFKDIGKKVILACREGKYDGYIAAHSFTNIFYILRRKYNSKERKELLLDLCNIFGVVGIDLTKLLRALNDAIFDDIEDYLQYDCAIEAKTDYIVTRDANGFANSSIPVLSPEGFLNIFETADVVL
jgi:predicted nucleic acid-binding protein